jgi:glycine/D-amino acid oxidase-like deaminating enzyme
MNYDYDLLIVGGGLVGGSLALALRDTPLRIAVIEAISEEQRISSSAEPWHWPGVRRKFSIKSEFGEPPKRNPRLSGIFMSRIAAI